MKFVAGGSFLPCETEVFNFPLGLFYNELLFDSVIEIQMKTKKVAFNGPRKTSIVFWLGVREIKCFVFQQNNDNSYKIYSMYIKLSVDFNAIIFFIEK